ncbi:MAG TPA: protein adenylyltransferase SelO family protein, partial [Polyangiaceae bacterium]|nr:protein adenylyltransferase SelO family protein [Polyangiaceae bacterium]
VALWNLSRFAEALWPLVGAEAPLQAGLDVYEQTLRRALHGHFLAKLGFRPEDRPTDANEFPSSADRGDPAPLGIEFGDGLLDELLRVLQLEPTDMTLFFRLLAEVPADRESLQRPDADLLAPLRDAFYAPQTLNPNNQAQIAGWLRAYLAASLARDLSPAERRKRMHAVNPRFVLRNYLAQLAIDEAERGETTKLQELLAVLRRPYDEQPEHAQIAEKRPDWARNRPGCSMLSCSS